MTWFASPLAGTAAVIAGLALLAVPLMKLTSDTPPAAPPAAAVASLTEIPAVLRVRLLGAAERVTVKTAAGKVLLDETDLPAGESEHDAVIPFDGRNAELTLHADFSGSSTDTAVFLTVMPDGYEDQTRFAIGGGAVEESLHFEWHEH
jgi:hypothetical protein